MTNKKDDKTYGYWEVTTSGDVEGRSIKQLGYHEGYIDEIALALAPMAMYELRFERIEKRREYKRERSRVHVTIKGFTHGNSESRASLMAELFKDRPVRIDKSRYYGAFLITTEDLTPEEKELIDLHNEVDRLNQDRVGLKNQIKDKLERIDELRKKTMK